MNKITTLFAIGIMSLLPAAAFAADAPASNSAGKAAASELHGFDKYWSKIDPTGKGYITKDDWMAHAADHFKDIDANGDGKISKDEMKAYDQKMFERRREMRQQYHKEHPGQQ